MAATPYKVILKFLFEDRSTMQIPVTGSDVTTEWLLGQDGKDTIILPSGRGRAKLIDCQFSAAGVDCSQCKIYVNGTANGVVLLGSCNLSTAMNRQLSVSPVYLPVGCNLGLEQLT